MIKEKKQAKNNKKTSNLKKKSVLELIRKDKYIPQFKLLIEETKKIGKISFTKVDEGLTKVIKKYI